MQNHIEPDDSDFDPNTQITTYAFLGWYHSQPEKALSFLISMIDVYVK